MLTLRALVLASLAAVCAAQEDGPCTAQEDGPCIAQEDGPGGWAADAVGLCAQTGLDADGSLYARMLRCFVADVLCAFDGAEEENPLAEIILLTVSSVKEALRINRDPTQNTTQVSPFEDAGRLKEQFVRSIAGGLNSHAEQLKNKSSADFKAMHDIWASVADDVAERIDAYRAECTIDSGEGYARVVSAVLASIEQFFSAMEELFDGARMCEAAVERLVDALLEFLDATFVEQRTLVPPTLRNGCRAHLEIARLLVDTYQCIKETLAEDSAKQTVFSRFFGEDGLRSDVIRARGDLICSVAGRARDWFAIAARQVSESRVSESRVSESQESERQEVPEVGRRADGGRGKSAVDEFVACVMDNFEKAACEKMPTRTRSWQCSRPWNGRTKLRSSRRVLKGLFRGLVEGAYQIEFSSEEARRLFHSSLEDIIRDGQAVLSRFLTMRVHRPLKASCAFEYWSNQDFYNVIDCFCAVADNLRAVNRTGNGGVSFPVDWSSSSCEEAAGDPASQALARDSFWTARQIFDLCMAALFALWLSIFVFACMYQIRSKLIKSGMSLEHCLEN